MLKKVSSNLSSSNSSFSDHSSDSISDFVTLDDYSSKLEPVPSEKVDAISTPQPVFEKEGSLNSTMITIIVDDIHFSLDSHFLQSESETLKDIITSSETNSIHLKDVTAAEVRALWRFFYEGMYDDYKPSATEWMDLFSFANTYGLKRVYNHAVAKIEDIDVIDDPINRVIVAKQLNVKKWLASAYVALCTRKDSIKASEAEKLGIHTFVTLVAARENFYRDHFQSTMIDRASSISPNLRCCGKPPSKFLDGANGARMCPTCQQKVIPGPGIQPAFTNNNRRCCGYQPVEWRVGVDGSRTCPGCFGLLLPGVVTANLKCCGYKPNQLTDGANGAKMCPFCHQIVIPGRGVTDFTNNNRRCCSNPPSSWKSQPNGSQICPSCKGITLPCASLSDHERALVHVKRVFDLEG